MYHIFAEDDNYAKRIADILTDMQNATYQMVDYDKLASNCLSPLNYNGTINTGHNYATLATQCPSYCVNIIDASARNGTYICDTLYKTEVKATLETILCKFS